MRVDGCLFVTFEWKDMFFLLDFLRSCERGVRACLWLTGFFGFLLFQCEQLLSHDPGDCKVVFFSPCVPGLPPLPPVWLPANKWRHAEQWHSDVIINGLPPAGSTHSEPPPLSGLDHWLPWQQVGSDAQVFSWMLWHQWVWLQVHQSTLRVSHRGWNKEI